MDWLEIQDGWKACKVIEENENNQLVFLDNNFSVLLKQWKMMDNWEHIPLETVAFIGGTGSGKSLYSNLIVHFIKYSDSLNWTRQATKVGLKGFSFGSGCSSPVNPGFLYPDNIKSGVYIFPELLMHGKATAKRLYCILHLHQVGKSDDTTKIENVPLAIFLKKICTSLINIVWDGKDFLSSGQIQKENMMDQRIINLIRGDTEQNIDANSVGIEETSSPLENDIGKITFSGQQNHAVRNLMKMITSTNTAELATTNIKTLNDFRDIMESCINYVNRQTNANTELPRGPPKTFLPKRCLPAAEEHEIAEPTKIVDLQTILNTNQNVKTLPCLPISTKRQTEASQMTQPTHVSANSVLSLPKTDVVDKPPTLIKTEVLESRINEDRKKDYKNLKSPVANLNDVEDVNQSSRSKYLPVLKSKLVKIENNVLQCKPEKPNIYPNLAEILNIESKQTKSTQQMISTPNQSKEKDQRVLLKSVVLTSPEENDTDADSEGDFKLEEIPKSVEINDENKKSKSTDQWSENLAVETMELVKKLVDCHEAFLQPHVSNFNIRIQEAHAKSLAEVLEKYDNEAKFVRGSEEFTVYRSILMDELDSVFSTAENKRISAEAAFEIKIEEECTTALMNYEQKLWNVIDKKLNVSLVLLNEKFEGFRESEIMKLKDKIGDRPAVIERIRAEMVSIAEASKENITFNLDDECNKTDNLIEEESTSDSVNSIETPHTDEVILRNPKTLTISERVKSLQESKESFKSSSNASDETTNGGPSQNVPSGRVKYLSENLPINPLTMMPGAKPPNRRATTSSILDYDGSNPPQ